MVAPLDLDWLSSNQGILASEIARVRSLLVVLDGADAPTPHEPRLSPDAPSRAVTPRHEPMARPPAFEALRAAFDLTTFERDLVLLCAGMELDASVAAACGAAHGDPQRSFPTFSLALSRLPNAHWNALLPAAPLRRWHLLEFASGGSPGAPLTTRPLRIDERVLHYLTGLPDSTRGCPVRPFRSTSNRMPCRRTSSSRLAWRRRGRPARTARRSWRCTVPISRAPRRLPPVPPISVAGGSTAWRLGFFRPVRPTWISSDGCGRARCVSAPWR